jgi:hypothetical protein
MSLPIPQIRLKEVLLPVMRQNRRRYGKFLQVLARPAIPGETILSVTSTGVETINVATGGDLVIQNLTQARELYVISYPKFVQRYTFAGEHDSEWSLYDPIGEVFALEIDSDVIERLECSSPFLLVAPWNAPQTAQCGDFLVSPLCFSEIYRIGREEFFQTYRLISQE